MPAKPLVLIYPSATPSEDENIPYNFLSPQIATLEQDVLPVRRGHLPRRMREASMRRQWGRQCGEGGRRPSHSSQQRPRVDLGPEDHRRRPLRETRGRRRHHLHVGVRRAARNRGVG